MEGELRLQLDGVGRQEITPSRVEPAGFKANHAQLSFACKNLCIVN